MMSTVEPRWEHFAHAADVGIRGIGPSREQAFEQAALALTAVITEPAVIKLEQKITASCEAADDEMLLVGWLNLLIYEMATRRMLFGRFEVFIKDNRLNAIIWGQKLDVSKHSPAVEVKGATVTNLSVKQDRNRRWIAQCVVDV